MATQLQLRRDTRGDIDSVTPVAGEPGFDSTENRLIVGDGTTAGGLRVAMCHELRGFLSGLILSNDAVDADHDIAVSVGSCVGSDLDEWINLSSAMTKRIDASWVAGTNQGGMSSSLTVSADTWYHVHAIRVSQATDIGFDNSITAANLVADHSATAYRRIGSVLTDSSSNIIGFSQVGDEFLWDNPPLDINVSNPGTAAVLRTLSIPLGIQTNAIINVFLDDASPSGSTDLYLSSPDADDEAPSRTAAPLATLKVDGNVPEQFTNPHPIRSNTSSQIRSRQNQSTAGHGFSIVTLGYIDTRGRFD